MNRSVRLLTTGLLGAAVWAAVWVVGAKAEPKPPAGESSANPLSKLAWMEGVWIRQEGGQVLEETWTSVEGDCMVGMFRWIKGGKLVFTELMTITVDDGTPVFRLRHFDRKMVPWEEKDAAFTYPLGALSEQKVAFENPARETPRRFVYERPSPDTLIVRLEGPDPKKKGKGFEFKRKGR